MTTPAPPHRIANVLSIAGVDPSGGAGLLADLKSFSALGTYGCGVVAALTAQNTRGVTAIHVPPIDFLRQQIDTLFADVRIDAVKIGMLGDAPVIRSVAERLTHWQAPNIVLDPVMIAKSGDALLARAAIGMLREALLPLALIITPNLPEAGVLLERSAPATLREMFRAAEALRELLPHEPTRWVLLKGGHLPGDELVDLLFDGDRMLELRNHRHPTRNTHGTGCSYSSAIAALLPQFAGQHRAVENVVERAHQWLQAAIATADRLDIGAGHGPVHHFHELWR